MGQSLEETLDLNEFVNIEHFKPDCTKCFGLCCVALYFSMEDGFPTDKSAGTPCPNLGQDFCCRVHDKLNTLGLKGCTAYECFGAGQQVSQVTFAGRDWRREPSQTDLMFEVFLSMRQLHEICWYLMEALSYDLESSLRAKLKQALSETKDITGYSSKAIIKFNLTEHHVKIRRLLVETGSFVQNQLRRTLNSNAVTGKRSELGRRHLGKDSIVRDYFGKDLRKKDLRLSDFRGACFIAANLEGADLTGTNFIGADMRDTNIKGADLSKSMFLSQPQVNSARGNSFTKLPPNLTRPKYWEC